MAVTVEEFTPVTTAGSKLGTSSKPWGEVRANTIYQGGAQVANLASPTFTGTPAAPTAAPGTNTTQLATTAFVQAALTGETITSSSQIASGIVENSDLVDAAAWTIKMRNSATTGSVADVALGSVTAEGSPASGMFALGFLSSGEIRKFDLGNLPGAGGLSSVVADTSPQLGGMLDANGQVIGDGTRTLLSFVEDGAAVNYLEVENEQSGAGPILRATGTDTNVDLELAPKGSGRVQSGGVDIPTISSSDTITNKTINFANNTPTNLPTTGLANNAVTVAKMATQAAWKGLLGNPTASTANVQAYAISDLTAEASPAGADLVLVEKSTGEFRKVTLTNFAAGLAGTDEQAQDAVGNILTDTNSIEWNYDDATPKIEANLHTATTAQLVTGAQGEINVGANGAYVALGTTAKTAGRGDRTPSNGEKDALAGAAGTPSSTNRYILETITGLTLLGSPESDDTVLVYDTSASELKYSTVAALNTSNALGASSELTINGSGAVTFTGSHHTIDTIATVVSSSSSSGGDASDNLDTISGLSDGQVIYFRPNNDGRTITVRHEQDNIRCAGGSNLTLDDIEDLCIGIKDGSYVYVGLLGSGGGGGGGSGGTVQGTDQTYDIQATNEGTTPGNARGEYSVDLQTVRSTASMVASGTGSAILGGANNRASASYATCLGGANNVAASLYSVAMGRETSANQYGGVAFGAAYAANTGLGTKQGEDVVIALQSSGNGSVEPLTLDGAGTKIAMATETAVSIRGSVIAKSTATGDVDCWEVHGVFDDTMGSQSTKLQTLTKVVNDSAGAVTLAWSFATSEISLDFTDNSEQWEVCATLRITNVEAPLGGSSSSPSSSQPPSSSSSSSNSSSSSI